MRSDRFTFLSFFLFGVTQVGAVDSSVDSEYLRSVYSVPDVANIEYPDFDAPSDELVELGRFLFFDNRLSGNESQSCATCHNPELGYSDGLRFSLGAVGTPGRRNTPHLHNLAWNSVFFWDGRAQSLEEQALLPIIAEDEMNLSLDRLLARLESVEVYRDLFASAFGDSAITSTRIAEALAAFERTLIVDNTPFDRFLKGEEKAISDSAKRGAVVFADKGRCMECHDGPNFTDNSFHNIGLADTDAGRSEVIGDESLKGSFKVPGLRNIAFSAPYMHDGSIGTLEDVVRFYNRGGDEKEGLSDAIEPLALTEAEIRDLVAFLGSLNQMIEMERPDFDDTGGPDKLAHRSTQ